VEFGVAVRRKILALPENRVAVLRPIVILHFIELTATNGAEIMNPFTPNALRSLFLLRDFIMNAVRSERNK
jgi:hypothetical protein